MIKCWKYEETMIVVESIIIAPGLIYDKYICSSCGRKTSKIIYISPAK